MKTTVDKCDKCGTLFENNTNYQKHLEIHLCLETLGKDFPEVKDIKCQFANGEWNVQRSEEWLVAYKKAIECIVGKTAYIPWTYGWFRTLNDNGNPFYSIACRVLNICPICFQEWGQAYFVKNCDHKKKEGNEE